MKNILKKWFSKVFNEEFFHFYGLVEIYKNEELVLSEKKVLTETGLEALGSYLLSGIQYYIPIKGNFPKMKKKIYHEIGYGIINSGNFTYYYHIMDLYEQEDILQYYRDFPLIKMDRLIAPLSGYRKNEEELRIFEQINENTIHVSSISYFTIQGNIPPITEYGVFLTDDYRYFLVDYINFAHSPIRCTHNDVLKCVFKFVLQSFESKIY